MPRYTKQRSPYECGPTALLNSLRWAGIKTGYKDSREALWQACLCYPRRGTYSGRFDSAIKELSRGLFTVRRLCRPTLQAIERHLLSGGTVVLNYRQSSNRKRVCRHFTFLAGISPDGEVFQVVNDYREGPAKQKVSRATFKSKNLQYQRVDPHCKAWFLTRE
jgi:hypothetical protein